VTGCSRAILEMDSRIGKLNRRVWVSGVTHGGSCISASFFLSRAVSNVLVREQDKAFDSPP
jgi:hypothetical protein